MSDETGWKNVNKLLASQVEAQRAKVKRLTAENERLRAANERLVEQNNTLVRQCDPNLSSSDLKAVDRHCDWVAFGHAYRAMLNARAALMEKPDA